MEWYMPIKFVAYPIRTCKAKGDFREMLLTEVLCMESKALWIYLKQTAMMWQKQQADTFIAYFAM